MEKDNNIMLRPKNLTDLYYWTLVFENGVFRNQIANNLLSKESRLDVNSPDEKHGRPFLITLTPRRPHLPLLHWKIPDGCKPFYAGANTMQGNQPVGFKYLVGYVKDKHRVYYSVDPETGVAEHTEDYEG